MNESTDSTATLRRGVYLIMLLITVSMMFARIATVRSASGQTPFLSANDRSRWSTIRSLVDHHTFELDDIIFRDGKRDRDWYSIDLVRHRGSDGHEHYYSSKPPLLTVLLAGKYWIIKAVTGATLEDQPFYVGRIMLVLANIIPLACALVVLLSMIERNGGSDWGRMFAAAMCCFGTFLITISVTLTNHLPGAIGAVIAVAAFLRILREPTETRRDWHWYLIAGLGAGFLTVNEFPALSLVGLMFLVLLFRNRTATLIWFTPPVALMSLSLLGLNYAAHQSWRPAYAHRGDGPKVTEFASPSMELDEGPISVDLRNALDQHNIKVSSTAVLKSQVNGGWMLWDESSQLRLSLRKADSRITVYEWDDWYRYEGSYWVPEKLAGVDRGEPSKASYLFQVLIGHHGVFSLTPVWLLMLWGSWIWHRSGNLGQRWLARINAIASLTCILFYTVGRPLSDRNYGGVTSGFRWMYWFIPLWLLLILPALDALNDNGIPPSRWKWWGRLVALAFLVVSVFSAFYPSDNPWTHPWIYQYWEHIGWIE